MKLYDISKHLTKTDANFTRENHAELLRRVETLSSVLSDIAPLMLPVEDDTEPVLFELTDNQEEFNFGIAFNRGTYFCVIWYDDDSGYQEVDRAYYYADADVLYEDLIEGLADDKDSKVEIYCFDYSTIKALIATDNELTDTDIASIEWDNLIGLKLLDLSENALDDAGGVLTDILVALSNNVELDIDLTGENNDDSAIFGDWGVTVSDPNATYGDLAIRRILAMSGDIQSEEISDHLARIIALPSIDLLNDVDVDNDAVGDFLTILPVDLENGEHNDTEYHDNKLQLEDDAGAIKPAGNYIVEVDASGITNKIHAITMGVNVDKAATTSYKIYYGIEEEEEMVWHEYQGEERDYDIIDAEGKIHIKVELATEMNDRNIEIANIDVNVYHDKE